MRAKLGSVYQRKKKLPDGTVQVLPTWWIQYSKNGQVFRESSKSEKQSDAERLLKKRAGEIATGKFAGLGVERIRIAELFQDVIEDYQATDRRTIDDLRSRLKNHLQPFFGEIRAADFSTQYVKRYIAARRGEKAQNATINRELAVLRRAFTLAAKCDPPRVGRVPHIQMLKEQNIRTGFLEYDGYVALRDELPWYIRPLFVVAYHVGGRRGELTSVRWEQVDFKAGQIRLKGADTKNQEARTLPIYGDMREWPHLRGPSGTRSFLGALGSSIAMKRIGCIGFTRRGSRRAIGPRSQGSCFMIYDGRRFAIWSEQAFPERSLCRSPATRRRTSIAATTSSSNVILRTQPRVWSSILDR